MKNLDPEALHRLLHASASEQQRHVGDHGPDERCHHCGHKDPCVNLNVILVPYESLPEAATKHGLDYCEALMAELRKTIHPLTNIQIAELAIAIKDRLRAHIGTHGLKENCPKCFESFPDVCPRLRPMQGVKFEDYTGPERKFALEQVKMIRRALDV